ncbi:MULTISPECIES: hypothetical protein [unclassified Mycolicibacterium]
MSEEHPDADADQIAEAYNAFIEEHGQLAQRRRRFADPAAGWGEG